MNRHYFLPDPVDGVFPTEPDEAALMLATGIMLTGDVKTTIMDTIRKSKGLAALHNNYVTSCDQNGIDRDERGPRLRKAMERVADVIDGAMKAELQRDINSKQTLDRIKP